MRLHHLRLRGIGPFRDQVDLDLSALGASGVFLLEGPTGSGKSTLLDAIVYALYGNLGKRAEGREGRIRSQFAAPTEPSFVDLVFETGSGIYRVRREPEYQRAKKRGSGTVTEHAKALLWRLGSPEMIEPVLRDAAGQGGGIEPIATRLDEVGGEVERAVGLSREQFTQTVLLPQGEFARFLRARTEERQQVLTRVFGTEIYEEIEKQLETMRRAARAEVDAATATLERGVERFLEAGASAVEEIGSADRDRPEPEAPEDAESPDGEAPADAESPGEGEAPTDVRPTLAEDVEALPADASALRLEDVQERAGRIERAVREAAERASDRSASAEAQEQHCREARATVETALDLLERRAQLDALATRLESEEPADRDRRRRLERHEIARPLAQLLTRQDTAREAAAERDRERDALISRTAGEDADLARIASPEGTGEHPAPETMEQAAAALAELASTETGRAGALDALVAVETALPRRRTELEERRAAHAAAQTQLAQQEAALAERPAQREALVAAREVARRAWDLLADAQVHRAAAEAVLLAAKDAASRAAAVQRTEKSARTALEAATRAQDAEHELRRRRTAGLAAELALTLEEDQPCPVCGAAEHPRPARTAADHVHEDQLAAAEQEREKAEKALAGAQAKLEAARAHLEAARTAAGERDVPTAAQELETARAAESTCREQQQEAARLEKRLQEHDEQTAALRERIADQRLAAEGLAARITAEAEALEADHRRTVEARSDAPSVAARRDAHRDRARAASALREAILRAGQAREALAAVEMEIRAARQDIPADLTDLAEDAAVRDAVLTESERAELATAVQEHAVRRARLQEGLAEPGIAEAVASEESLGAARQVLRTAQESLEAAAAASRAAQQGAGGAQRAAARTARALIALGQAVTEVGAVQGTARTTVRIADLATGTSRDGDRIRLSTFVLMRRFEDVILAANARLARFAGTDLELARETGSQGARKTGLELRVIDRRTDQARAPETLSGGETFFVSLALALGLADIVTAEAGGVQMQTLFIDEGFGSLDPEKLESVIGEVGRLADAGRTVGIVSHVTELKGQIPEQIHVRRREDRTSEVTVTA